MDTETINHPTLVPATGSFRFPGTSRPGFISSISDNYKSLSKNGEISFGSTSHIYTGIIMQGPEFNKKFFEFSVRITKVARYDQTILKNSGWVDTEFDVSVYPED